MTKLSSKKKFYYFGILAAAAIFFTLLSFKLSSSISIDSCLDMGGAWDYKNNICSNKCVDVGGKSGEAMKQCIVETSH